MAISFLKNTNIHKSIFFRHTCANNIWHWKPLQCIFFINKYMFISFCSILIQPLTAYMSVSVPILIMLIMVGARNDSNTGIRPHTTSLQYLLCTNNNSCIRMGRCLGGRHLIPSRLKYKFWVQVCGLWLIKIVIKERQNRTNTQTEDVSSCRNEHL